MMSDRFEVRATAADHFAWLRTRLAIERTMMAWARTGVSLIGFGFTIVQFFDRLGAMPGVAPARFPDAPHYLGLMLIFCGTCALAIATLQYWGDIRYLWSDQFAAIAGTGHASRRPPMVAAVVALMLVGVFAFFAVLFRLL